MCVPHQPYPNQVATLLYDTANEAATAVKAYRDSLSRGARAIVGPAYSAQTRLALCVLSYPIHAHHTRLLYTLVCLPPTLTPNPYQVPCPAWRSRPGLLALGLVPEFGKGARENPQSQNSRPILQPLVTRYRYAATGRLRRASHQRRASPTSVGPTRRT